jgi:hypothetical protein
VATLLAAASVAGCGSGAERHAAPAPPRLPRALAGSLAAQSDAVARALEAGDSCQAASLAHALQANTIAAINTRRVPAALQEPLASSVTDLVSRIRCVPPPPAEERGHGKKKGHGKKEGDD